MHRANAILAAALLLATGLAGCLGSDEGDMEASDASLSTGSTEGQAGTETNTDPALVAQGVHAPSWEVGDWWTWHHEATDMSVDWTLAVTEDTGQAWRIAPDAQEPARFDAIFDWYVLGPMDKQTLSDEVSGGLIFYDFPLTDGKTWTSTFAPDGPAWTVEHTATFDPAIETAQGPLPGYAIQATVNGSVFFMYDYVPAIGFFSQLMNHVLPEESDSRAGEVDWSYHTQAWGANYTGELYHATGEQVADIYHEIDVEPEADELPEASPNPVDTFEVAETADAIFVIQLAGSTAGMSQVTLTDPEGTEYQAQSMSTGLNGAVAVSNAWYDAVPGEWSFRVVGAGLDTEAWVGGWQVSDEVIELT